jgi:hypothetical protein
MSLINPERVKSIPHIEEQMHMILDAANDKRLSVEAAEDATEIAVDLLTQRSSLKKWSALFRRKDQMQKNLCERLRHASMMREEAF